MKRVLAFILLSLALSAYALAATFNMTPYIDTNYAYTANVITDDDTIMYSDYMSVIGAQSIQATLTPNDSFTDTVYATYEVSNDLVNWLNASSADDSTLLKAGSVKSLYFPYTSVYRYHRIRFSFNTTAQNDTVSVAFRAGARTSR
jgi:hypothetical protein